MFGGERQSSLRIALKRIDRIYRHGEKCEGRVIVDAYKGWQHQGLRLYATGYVYLNTSAKGVGIMDVMSSGIKPVLLLKEEIEIASVGSFADGETSIPFEFQVVPVAGQMLQESYHGVFLNVIYAIRVECDRGVLKKSLQTETEFVIEILSKHGAETASPAPFCITPESIDSIPGAIVSQVPRFKISGSMHRSIFAIGMPFTGEVTIEECTSSIKSLELQLVRVETIERNDGYANIREATEVQNIQIADGDVSRGMAIPM